MTEDKDENYMEPADDDAFEGYRSIRDEMRERFPPSDVQKALDAHKAPVS